MARDCFQSDKETATAVEMTTTSQADAPAWV